VSLRVAAVAWKLRLARGDSDYLGHFHDLVSRAHDEGAEVVVFPELHGLELLSLASDLEARDAGRFLIQFADEIEDWIARIASNSGMVIVGGSHFKETPEGIKNVCAIGLPTGERILQEKNNLTVYEREVWRLTPGKGLARLPHNLGVTICYDSEFPEAGRVLAEAGMMVQCVPSWTETIRGFQRVRWSCLARALENQIFVVHASLVGDLEREPVPTTYGSSAILAPSVEPFPESAVLRESRPNEEGVVVADLDFDLLHQARTHGEVTNWRDRHDGSWELTGEFPADAGRHN
jgi:predicted amidohydrolase